MKLLEEFIVDRYRAELSLLIFDFLNCYYYY